MNEIKKIAIFYFSGTGNSKRIASWLSEYSSEKQVDCHLYNIAKIDIVSIKLLIKDALIIIISPVHGFNFPKITLDFIRHFPKGENNIVLMNTRAGMKLGRFITPGLTGVAFIISSIILKSKGYKIVGQVPFDMPSNWISLHPSLNDKTVKYLHKVNYERLKIHFIKILSKKSDFFAYRDIVQDILISPISLGYYLVGRYAFAKTFFASVDCDNCGSCIKQCPVNAIEIKNNKPFWTFNCESCMKCMNNCPKNAIETSHGLIVIASFVCSLITTYLLSIVTKDSFSSEFISYFGSSIIFVSLLWVFYRIQHVLLRNKFFGKLISMTALTHYKFWGRYKSISNDKWK